MSRKKKTVHKRRRSVGAVHHRRRTTGSRRRKSAGMMGAFPANAGEKILGIALGSVGITMLEGVIIKKKPNLSPMIIGGAELVIGALLSGNNGMEGFIGDGMIAAGAINLARAIKAKHMSGVGAAEYVINGTEYVTGGEYITGDPEDMFITEDGYVINGAGQYITGPGGEYITGEDLVMGDVNQGGLGDVNQGGLG